MYYSEHCRVSDEEVKQLCQMQQLTELHLGTATDKADDDSNIFTVIGFTAVLRALKTMPKLTKLNMQLPYVKRLDIYGLGTHS
jgi:hypothetical protein